MAMQKIVLASNNPGKLREFASLFEPLGIELVPQGMLGVSEAEEPHVTFIENALTKARHAASATGLPALADDSGLCVPILGGAPGVYSARYAARAGREKSDAANNRHLIEQLAPHADTPGYRDAYYFAALVLVRHATDPQPIIAEGRWDGEIVDTARGAHGFGYDPHFLIRSLSQTAAELDPAVKNAHSHRARALRVLLEKLGREA